MILARTLDGNIVKPRGSVLTHNIIFWCEGTSKEGVREVRVGFSSSSPHRNTDHRASGVPPHQTVHGGRSPGGRVLNLWALAEDILAQPGAIQHEGVHAYLHLRQCRKRIRVWFNLHGFVYEGLSILE